MRHLLNVFNSLRSKEYYGFIKSFAILLLATVMLVTSVLAWFSSDSSATANGISISVSTSTAVTVSNGSATLSETVSLPAATKPSDSEITASLLSKVLVYKWYKVETADASSVALQFDVSNGGLICCCFTVANEAAIENMTDLICAERVKASIGSLIQYDDNVSSVVNSPQTLTLNNGVCYVIIAYMADYNVVGGRLNSDTSPIIFEVDLTFVPMQ